jgi:periplasmic protein TonB
VTVRQFPQPGDVVATRAQDQGGADLHGVALVARRDEPPQSETTDLSNVIPFARPRRAGAAAPFPLPSVAADERPAPQLAKIAIGASIAFFAVSLALHSGLLAMFWHEPRPRPSIGVEAISVEIVIGATAPAGAEPTPGEKEAVPAPQAEEHAEDKIVTGASRATTVMPQEVPVAAEETALEAQPQTIPEVQTVEPKPQEQPPETATAELQESTEPTERTQAPRPQVQAVQKAPERKRIDAPKDKKAAQKNQVATAAPSNSANNVGVGRSQLDEDRYRALVSARLVRYKQYPAGARGEGRPGVSFDVDGSGRVTSARLVSSSGNAAFDQEVVAMARRASPFPPPPDGKGRNFTVYVRFEEPRR